MLSWSIRESAGADSFHSDMELGLIRWGSLVKRFIPCGKNGCCCQDKPPKLHGPYYQWTKKVRGKTMTVRLSPQEAKLLEGWILNGRQFKKIISQMEKISLRLSDQLLRAERSRSTL